MRLSWLLRGAPLLALASALGCNDSVGASVGPARIPSAVPAPAASIAPDQLATINGLIALVDGWVATQVLSPSDAAAMQQLLARALTLYSAGNISAGQAVLGAVAPQVQRLTRSGALSAQQAAQITAPLQSLISGGILFTQVALSNTNGCGLAPGGYAYCWGDNTYGQLGYAGPASPRAVLVSSSQTFTSIGVGDFYACALAADGTAWCWGGNMSGQLGDGTTVDRPTPAPVSGGHAFTGLSVAYALTCGTVANGDAYCWGSGGRLGVDLGGLGGPAPSTCGGYYVAPWLCSLVPQKVTGGLAFTEVDAATWYGCGRTSGGAAHCWGWNQFYNLGDGTRTNAIGPVPVSGGIAFSAIELGGVTSCGLDTAGAAYCWGGWAFNYGQLGTGSFLPSPTPTPVVGGHTFRLLRVARGNNIFTHTCAIDTSDQTWCWGMNDVNQLGGTASEVCGSDPCSSTPIRSAVGFTFADLAAGSQATCGITPGGEAWCWGRNGLGQLGNGTTTDTPTPTRIVR